MSKIVKVNALTIFDSRSIPTIEVAIQLNNGITQRASVPSGASRGTREAVELRDGNNRFLGMGVDKAVSNVNEIIYPEIANMEVTEQREIDEKMIVLDGTENKSRLGANAILGVSLAVAKAASADLGIPLYRYIGKLYGEPDPRILPVPMMNFLNGGAHANNDLDFQEFMIMPLGAKDFYEASRMGSELFCKLSQNIKSENSFFKASGVGDEGGFDLIYYGEGSYKFITEKTLEILMKGIELAGYKPYKDILITLDPAASEFYKDGKYILKGGVLSSEEMVDFYSYLIKNYPIISIEDGMAEADLDGWKLITDELGHKIQIVGDDLFVTNPKILKDGIKRGIANAILIKVNQIGTLTETLETIKIAQDAGYATIISHRSGETEDTTISDIAVGCNAGQIKTGCIARAERTAKFNQLLRIMQDLGDRALFLGHDAIQKGLTKTEKLKRCAEDMKNQGDNATL